MTQEELFESYFVEDSWGNDGSSNDDCRNDCGDCNCDDDCRKDCNDCNCDDGDCFKDGYCDDSCFNECDNYDVCDFDAPSCNWDYDD